MRELGARGAPCVDALRTYAGPVAGAARVDVGGDRGAGREVRVGDRLRDVIGPVIDADAVVPVRHAGVGEGPLRRARRDHGGRVVLVAAAAAVGLGDHD